MADEVSGWERVLDHFEARLHAQRSALELGAVDVIEPLVTPAVTGPVPPALNDRAVSLVHACRALEDDIATALDAAKRELDRLADQPAASDAAREPVYFDSRV